MGNWHVLYIHHHITLKGKYHWPTYMLRKQTQHITNCDLYTSNPLEKDLTGKCRDGKFLQPLGVWWRGQFLRACDSYSPSSQSGKVLTLADQLTQRHNDVPEVLSLSTANRFDWAVNIPARFMQLLWWTPNLSRLTCPLTCLGMFCVPKGRDKK